MTIPGQDPFEGKMIDERYRLRRRVGAGGMSLVYLAERVGMGKPIAIKFLRSAFANLPGFVRRFEQEAKACSRLNHLHCVSVMDFGVAFGIPYLVMEYVGGTTLAEVVQRGPLAPPRAIRIVRQLLAGLRHAHARSVIHRDLKPANVMLVEMTGTQDFAKIMDFGTAQILTGESSQRQGGTDIGTPWYMAPEQAAGQPTDHRTDLYAVGVILFELLTGERPYIAEDPLRVLQMHLSSPIPSLRALKPAMGLSPELEGAIVRAMQKRPEERFQDAAAFEEALTNVPESIRDQRSSRRTGPEPLIEPAAAPDEEELEPAEPPDDLEPLTVEREEKGGPGRAIVAIVITIIALGLGGYILYMMGVFGH